jgi:hypothetical protein
VRFVDEALQQLARRTLLRQIVAVQFEPFTFQVGYRFAAARSRRFQPHLHAFRRHHFFLTHHASGAAAAPDTAAGVG